MKSKNEKIGLVVLIATAILAISAFSVILTPVSAQPVEVWNVTWSDIGTAVATTEDSVYLVGVNTNLTDAFLNKYDKDGNLLWNSTWEMFAPEVGGSNVVATAAAGDSVYLAGGCAFSNVTGLDAFLNKYDSDGNFLWNITWGGTGATSATVAYATAAVEDCVFLAGETAPSNVSDFDAFLNKYDGDGNLLWNITWGGPGTYSANAVATSGDSVYVAGRAPGGKAFLNRYNSTDGNFLWNRNVTCGGIGTQGWATTTGDNAVYLAGRTGLDTVPGAFLNKYNSTDGSLIWNVTWGKTGNDHGRAIATAEDGVVYLAGNRGSFLANESDAFLVKFSEPTPIPTPTSDVHAILTPAPTPTASPTPTPPGFEAGFTIAGLLAVSYLVLRRR